MGRPVARKKQHKGDKPLKAKYRTRRRTKDHDQIHVDMQPENARLLLNQPANFDVAGNAEFYCLHCARYFISNDALNTHFTSKLHKRRLKALRIEPYSQQEAERAAGMGSYKAPQTVEVKTQPAKEEMDIKESVSDLSDVLSGL